MQTTTKATTMTTTTIYNNDNNNNNIDITATRATLTKTRPEQCVRTQETTVLFD